ncbi:MAG: hypothetical protein ACPKNR_05735 [Pleomorphochaeta sp.]
MMKKAFLISIYLLCCFNLFATTYNSNSIGQKLGEYDGKSEFYLVEEANTTTIKQTLYNNNQLLQTKTINEKNDIKTITIDDFLSRTYQVFNNNNLISEMVDNIKTVYNYEQNKLISKIISESDNILEVDKYFYLSNGQLLAILKVKNDTEIYYIINFNDDNLSISYSSLNSKNYKKSQITEGIINSIEYKDDKLVNNIEVEKTTDDSLILTKQDNNSLKKEYYSKGVLDKVETYNNDVLIKSIKYYYNDDYLLTKTILDEKNYSELTKSYDRLKQTITNYENNKISKVQVYENNELTSSYYFDRNNYKIEDLYQNGNLYCTITYDGDNIIDIQYRNEGSDGI